MKPLRALLAGAMGMAVAVLLTIIVPAGAQTAPAKPAPCTGATMPIVDPAEDQAWDEPPFSEYATPGANMDITGAFFSYDDSKKKSYANIQVAELDKTLPPADPAGAIYSFDAITWTMAYTVGGVARYVSATIDFNEELTAAYGTGGEEPAEEGETTAVLHEGPSGIVQIEIPAAAGGAVNAALSEVSASTSALLDLVAVTFTPGADVAPDEDSVSAAIKSCAPPPAPPKPPPPTTTPTVTTPADPFPKGVLALEGATLAKRSAKAASRRHRTIDVVLDSGDRRVFDLVGKLRRGGRVYAIGRLTDVEGREVMELRRRKKLRKGTYQLRVTGSRSCCGFGRAAYQLKIR